MPWSAVVDTSVLVSAFLFPDSVPGRVLTFARQGRYALHVSPIILEETRRSLHNPRLRKAYRYPDVAIAAWCAERHPFSQGVPTPVTGERTRLP
jgi:predicted nucleic acid-binding protein